MTSLLTNTAAMVALQTLTNINNDLNETNNRISTGLKIRTAGDNPAYWAIATTTQSDNDTLATVQDALSIGQATFDVTYAGLEAVRENLQTMKELLVAARQPGVDRANVQTQITGIIADMQNKAGAAVLNEQNFLSVDSSAADYNNLKDVVASFERTASGISVSTIQIDIDNIKLIDDAGGTPDGILDIDRTGTNSTTAGVLDLNGTAISSLSDSTADLDDLDDYIEIVDAALTDVITAQNEVGVVLSRVESQDRFVQALSDANTRAVGTLQDADMEMESTRLAALQTQQQLSIQSLGIANSSTQNLLALFR